ncbi:hypothetical protein F5880DRAFT_1506466, partial [Lentinula raphanica]
MPVVQGFPISRNEAVANNAPACTPEGPVTVPDKGTRAVVSVGKMKDLGSVCATAIESDSSQANQYLSSPEGSRKEFPKYVKSPKVGSELSNIGNKDVVEDNSKVGELTTKKSHSVSPVAGKASYAAIVKGKFADRNAEIDDSELAVEAQRAALKNWNQVRDASYENSPVIINIENNGDKSQKRNRKKANGSQRCKEKRSKCAQVESNSSLDSETFEPKHKRGRKNRHIIEAVQPMSHSYSKHIRK